MALLLQDQLGHPSGILAGILAGILSIGGHCCPALSKTLE